MIEKKKTTEVRTEEKKVSKTWEAAMRLKGSVVVNDKTLYAR